MVMSDKDFDEFVDSLQDKIFTEAREAYGPKGFERWRNPKFCGSLSQPSCHARVTGTCGDTIEMWLRIDGDRVVEGGYFTTGCGSSSICGSFTVELALGRGVEEVFDLQGQDVLAHIGGLPDADSHCAYLAVEVLHEAVNGYLVEQARKIE